MPKNMSVLSPFRVVVVLLCFLITFVLMQRAVGTQAINIIRPLASFPTHIGPWTLNATRKSDPEVIKMLGVDDYIDYSYVDTKGKQINLYVGFYESVGGGKGYHSPKNCLPGGGWGIDQVGTVQITPRNKNDLPVTVSEMVIREGDEYQVVLYWFQNRGRIIASEYWEKVYLVLDALMKHRRDGTFVRLMASVPQGNVKETEKVLKEFAGRILPELNKYLPGKEI